MNMAMDVDMNREMTQIQAWTMSMSMNMFVFMLIVIKHKQENEHKHENEHEHDMNNAKNIGVAMDQAAMVIDMAAMDMDSDIDTKIDNCKGIFAETKSVARVRILK
jgi:hypothetical protein